MAYLHLSHSKRWLESVGGLAPRWHEWAGSPARCMWCGHLRSEFLRPYTTPPKENPDHDIPTA